MMKWERTYPAGRDEVYRAALGVIARSGWTVTDALPEAGVLAFTAPPSFFSSPKGTRLTATVLDGDGSADVVIVGARGGSGLAGSQAKRAQALLDGLDAALRTGNVPQPR